MQKILSSFSKKYKLHTSDVIIEIENVFSAVLSEWYRMEVMVMFLPDCQLEALAYSPKEGGYNQKLIDLSKISKNSSLMRKLEKRLMRAAIIKQVQSYKCYEKQLLWGEVAACDNSNLYVEFELNEEKITGICPLNRLGVHERESTSLSVGMKRAFHLRRVEAVSIKGTPRLEVIVDRVSKTLVEELLKYQLGQAGDNISIRCVNRYVGHKSFVISSKKLPRSAITAVTRELGERMEVKFCGHC